MTPSEVVAQCRVQANRQLLAGTAFRTIRGFVAILNFVRGLYKDKPSALKEALDALGPYERPRKSNGSPHRSRHCVAHDKRAALKRRNQLRNKV